MTDSLLKGIGPTDVGPYMAPGSSMLGVRKGVAGLQSIDSRGALIDYKKQNGAEDPSKVEAAAQQFEGMLLQQMLSAMWKTVPESPMFGKSQELDIYRDMLNEAVSNSIATGRGIGIKEVIARDIRKLEHK